MFGRRDRNDMAAPAAEDLHTARREAVMRALRGIYRASEHFTITEAADTILAALDGVDGAE